MKSFPITFTTVTTVNGIVHERHTVTLLDDGTGLATAALLLGGSTYGVRWEITTDPRILTLEADSIPLADRILIANAAFEALGCDSRSLYPGE